MNAAEVIAALDLPGDARVDQRVPKKLVIENGAPAAADKRRINEGIEEIRWLAALKPTTIGVPDYRTTVREYLEIAVISIALRPGAKVDRLTELIHRAVPYPVFLVTAGDDELIVSLAHKRWSLGESGETVLDGELVAVDFRNPPVGAFEAPFLKGLLLTQQPHSDLYALYQGWIDTVVALLVARITGSFAKAESVAHGEARRNALKECTRLEAQMAQLRAAATKATQVSRQVELNLELKRVQVAHAAAYAKL